MARPQRNTVDYFPHPVTHGKKMSYLEKKYKNDGYATWFKILEELGNTDYHYLDLSDDVQIMFLSDRCLVSEDVLMSIISDLIRMKEFDKNLWESNRILFNKKFVESIKDAYKKRSNECVTEKSLLILLDSLGIRKLPKSNRKPQKSNPQGDVKPQSKVEYSKVKKSKEKESIENAHDFLKINKQIEYETFVMQNQKFIDDWKLCIDNFNSTINLEIAQNKIEYETDQLMPRFEKWIRSWIKNQKNSNIKNQNHNQPPIKRNRF